MTLKSYVGDLKSLTSDWHEYSFVIFIRNDWMR